MSITTFRFLHPGSGDTWQSIIREFNFDIKFVDICS